MAEDKETNSLQWKKILSLLRDGDYAHPGEVEAIEKVFSSLSKNPERKILDVGCGVGGTANYLQSHGWGQVTGIDINGETLSYAKSTYSTVKFFEADILSLTKIIQNKFDLIYLFNSFYAFDDQKESLNVMRKVANPGCELVIFEYVDRGGYEDMGRAQGNAPVLPYPINVIQFEEWLKEAGWQLDAVENIDEAYLRWYQDLMDRIDQKKKEIINMAGEKLFQKVRNVYAHILKEVERGVLGGGVFRARKI